MDTGIGIGGEPSARGYAALERTLATNIRVMKPAEIASLLVFLASDEASSLNGAALVADSGWTAF